MDSLVTEIIETFLTADFRRRLRIPGPEHAAAAAARSLHLHPDGLSVAALLLPDLQATSAAPRR